MLVRSIIKDSDNYSEWQFGHSFADYRSKQDQIMQDIYTALYEWKYDCFFAIEHGIDWYTRLGMAGQKTLLDQDILDVIQNRTGVLSVFDFNSTLEGRNYTCACSVLTEYSNNDTITINFAI